MKQIGKQNGVSECYATNFLEGDSGTGIGSETTTELAATAGEEGTLLEKDAWYYWLLLAEGHLTRASLGPCRAGSRGCQFPRGSPGSGSRKTDENAPGTRPCLKN